MLRRLVVGFVLGTLACAVEGRGDADDCVGAPPPCIAECGSDVQIAAHCYDAEWLCVGGVLARECAPVPECEGEPIACVDGCDVAANGGASHDATCTASGWSCGDGVPAVECGVCAGAPPTCIDECGSDVEVAQAKCEGIVWSCSDGVPDTACASCEGEEPLECVVDCDEGEIYEATCEGDAWSCGDGVALETCTSSPPDPGTACEGDAWTCVPSCAVFEPYDATCVGTEWSCEGGVLAADC